MLVKGATGGCQTTRMVISHFLSQIRSVSMSPDDITGPQRVKTKSRKESMFFFCTHMLCIQTLDIVIGTLSVTFKKSEIRLYETLHILEMYKRGVWVCRFQFTSIVDIYKSLDTHDTDCLEKTVLEISHTKRVLYMVCIGLHLVRTDFYFNTYSHFTIMGM